MHDFLGIPFDQVMCMAEDRQERLDAAITRFRVIKAEGGDPQDYVVQVLSDYGFTEDDLTDSEVNRIIHMVNRW